MKHLQSTPLNREQRRRPVYRRVRRILLRAFKASWSGSLSELKRRIALYLRGVSLAPLKRMLMRPGWAVATAAFFVLPAAHAVDLSDVESETGGFYMPGINTGDLTGWSVSNAGDVNGDGLDDVIVGAYMGESDKYNNAGRSYVVFGKTSGTQAPLSSVASGVGGFVIDIAEYSAYTGYSVSGAGDVNGDGLDDLIVGRYGGYAGSESEAGLSYVVFGKTNTSAVDLEDIVNGTGGFVINGADASDFSGWAVSGSGDVNGDGLDDVIIGAPWADPGSDSQAGESYVVFGKTDTSPVNLSDVIAGTGGFAILGIDASDDSGASVSGAGDVNGDGLDDVIIGAYDADPSAGTSAGEAYVVFGKTNGTAVDLSTVASESGGGFVINGAVSGGDAGKRVSGAGDVNGDGLDDVIVGAWLANTSYVVFGKASNSAVELSSLSGTSEGFAIAGNDNGDASGFTVSGAGDMNDDGFDDVLVGAHNASPGGEAYVVFGKASSTTVQLSSVVAGTGGFVINAAASGDRAGFSVSGGGDVNGDGSPDVVVGAPMGTYTGPGGAYVVFSPTAGSETVWVDFGHFGTENGNYTTPYNDVASAISAVNSGGEIRFKGDSTVTTNGASPTISKEVTLRSFGGNGVRIGGS